MLKTITNEISIKKTKANRDKFLGEILIRDDRDEMVQTALDLVYLAENSDQIKTQYDRANARTCAAILWWFADEIENAKLHIHLAIKELNKPQLRRDRLTFLVKRCIYTEVPAKEFLDCFLEGGR
jgi:hypothetical protein